MRKVNKNPTPTRLCIKTKRMCGKRGTERKREKVNFKAWICDFEWRIPNLPVWIHFILVVATKNCRWSQNHFLQHQEEESGTMLAETTASLKCQRIQSLWELWFLKTAGNFRKISFRRKLARLYGLYSPPLFSLWYWVYLWETWKAWCKHEQNKFTESTYCQLFRSLVGLHFRGAKFHHEFGHCDDLISLSQNCHLPVLNTAPHVWIDIALN